MTEDWCYADHTPPTKAGTYRVRVASYKANERGYLPNVNKAEWRIYPSDPLGGRWFFDGKLSPYIYGLVQWLKEE